MLLEKVLHSIAELAHSRQKDQTEEGREIFRRLKELGAFSESGNDDSGDSARDERSCGTTGASQ